MVYVARVGSNRPLPDEVVRLTEATGGGHVVISRDSDFRSAIARIAEELRHQYLLGFVPRAADGRQHSIEVRLTTPGLVANARRSYIAERAP
jgi:hypothetical protein